MLKMTQTLGQPRGRPPADNQNRKRYINRCEWCKTTFSTSRPDAMYCGAAHRSRAAHRGARCSNLTERLQRIIREHAQAGHGHLPKSGT